MLFAFRHVLSTDRPGVEAPASFCFWPGLPSTWKCGARCRQNFTRIFRPGSRPGLSLVLTTVPTRGPNIQAECSREVNVMRKGAPEDALVITLESHRVSRDLFTRGLRSHKHDVCQQKGTSFA